MPRVLSSSSTIVWRYVFPSIWITGFGAGTFALLLGAFHGRHGEPAPEFMRWLFPSVWLFASAYLIHFARRLCRVVLLPGQREVEVSRIGHSATVVPLSSVARVSQSYLMNPPTITLHLAVAAPFGQRVLFLPGGRPHHFSEHPLTRELRALVARERVDSSPDA